MTDTKVRRRRMRAEAPDLADLVAEERQIMDRAENQALDSADADQSN